MAKIYIFGVTPFAELLSYYIRDVGQDEFAGYVVDEEYMPPNNELGGVEVISWKVFTSTVSPDSCKILSSVTYNNMNKAREIVFHRIKDAGYELANFIHPTSVVAANCEMGEGNIILERVIIQPFVKLGNNNVFFNNANISHHTTIGSYNYFGASSVVMGKVTVEDRCFIGCNASVRNRTIVKSDTLIGAAAYSRCDTEESSVLLPPRSVILEKKSSEIKL